MASYVCSKYVLALYQFDIYNKTLRCFASIYSCTCVAICFAMRTHVTRDGVNSVLVASIHFVRAKSTIKRI